MSKASIFSDQSKLVRDSNQVLAECLKVGLRCDGDHGDKGMVNQRASSADYRMIRHASRRPVTSENQLGISWPIDD